jgi:hypothetical protein
MDQTFDRNSGSAAVSIATLSQIKFRYLAVRPAGRPKAPLLWQPFVPLHPNKIFPAILLVR